MPECRKCPDCRFKAEPHIGKYRSAYFKDELRFVIDDLITDTKFMCLTCERIYQNSESYVTKIKE